LVRPVAVKMLAPRFAADPDSRERIRAEAQAAARLCHPYITNVYDYGESRTPDGAAVPFVVMELVDGESLDSALKAGPLPWQRAAEVSAQVAAALAAIHARGLVHRDIKPANVMLTTTGAKVVDFGISAVAGDRPEAGGKVYGTPAYLAPERLDGGPADAASDVYGLGLVLYRALTGRLPWDAETTTQMLTAHCYVQPDPLPRIGGLPPTVAKLCHRCLAKEPSRRPSAADVARVLAEVTDLRVPLVGVQVSGPPAPRGPQPEATRPGRAVAGRSARRRWVRVGSLAAGVAAAVLGLATCSTSDAPGSPTAQAATGSTERNAGRVAAPEQGCQVQYATRSDAAGQFAVDLTVVNGGAVPIFDWNLNFEYPGDQRVLQLDGANWAQDGGRVTVHGPIALHPGAAATVSLTGAYGAGNPMPTAFELDGRQCAGRVVGAAGAQPPAGGTEVDAAGGGGTQVGSGSRADSGRPTSGPGKKKGKKKRDDGGGD